jgi:hypothetical protein
MKIIAHRGASGEFPENTLQAFEQAITQQADGIELDAQYHQASGNLFCYMMPISLTTLAKSFTSMTCL